ncbi:MAG: hypothetical protein PWQ37_2334 [Candidatus Petromonas sp.]|jgi:hypothetical protein|nr:hypothetical protein [Candidatus Petromonas sp.]
MDLNDFQKGIIEMAYQSHKDFVEENREAVKIANETLKEFHREIELWDDSKDIEFIFADNNEKYLIGERPNNICDEGNANHTRKNFIKFMHDKRTKNIVKKMFNLRKKNELDFTIPARVYKLALFDHLKEYKFRGDKPWLYTLRFVIMTFPELFTTIADRKKLFKTAKILQFQNVRDDKKNYRFELVEFQIRSAVDSYLKEMGVLDDLTLWGNAAVAYNIVDEYKRA